MYTNVIVMKNRMDSESICFAILCNKTVKNNFERLYLMVTINKLKSHVTMFSLK